VEFVVLRLQNLVEHIGDRIPQGPLGGQDLIERNLVSKFELENAHEYRDTATRPPVTGTPTAGRLKGLISVPADFDEPLEELREYME
jgi:hypothetical protein